MDASAALDVTKDELLAEKSPTAGPWRVVLSFPAMIAVGLALVTFLTCRERFNDPDTWWHLKVGEIIWKSHSLPRSDIFSHTTNNHSWIPHEWLSQVMLYGAYRLGGYSGLFLWLCGLASLIFILLYVLCSLYSGNANLSLLGGLMGWFFGTIGLAVRPLILGHFFLVVELLVLHFARTKDRRWLAALPPLFALWVNCHGSYAIGLVVLGIFTFSSFVDLRAGCLISQRCDRRERLQLGGVLVLCGAALLANPTGLTLLRYPLDVFTKQSDGLASVSEWQPLTVDDPRGLGVLATAAIVGMILLARPGVLYVQELLLLVLGVYAALRHARLCFIFGILVAPLLCRLLAGAWQHYDQGRDHRLANGFLILVFIALMVTAFPTRRQLEAQVSGTFPVGAVDFIRRAGLSGPMFNEYEWGGYLIWALPEQKVFIDGRADVFDWTGVLREYGRWVGIQEDPNILLEKYGIQFCLLRKSARMASVMPYLPGWEKVYADEKSVIFARRPTG